MFKKIRHNNCVSVKNTLSLCIISEYNLKFNL